MPTNSFNESLINRPTPWAACAALEEFFAQGGQCRVTDKTNWIGIVFTCSTKAATLTEASQPDLLHALGWSHLAIAIRESMASTFSQDDSVGIIKGAMFVRANMIVCCGNHPGDPICDCDKLVEWCISLPSVGQTLQMKKAPPILYVDGEVREVAEILSSLVEAGRLKYEGEVARLLDFIAQAKATPRDDTSGELRFRAASGEF